MVSEQLDEVFGQTLSGAYDDDAPWAAVSTLRRMGSREVFDCAAQWCNSQNPLKRARGADVLAQLGKTADHPSNNFPDESFSVVSALVREEKDPLPLLAAIHALGHIGNPLAVPLLTQHCLHPNSDVRFAVAFALGKFANDASAIEVLLALMRDVDDDVRDWATFGLGEIGDADSNGIRDALYERLTDASADVREGALAGLSKRKDKRVLPILIAELSMTDASDRVKEAAELFLGEDEHRPDWRPCDYIAALQKNL